MIESLRKNKIGILLMIVSSICVCFGQLFWKIASNSNTIGYLFVGFLLYGVGAIIMIIAYKFGSLSVLQPMLSMNYVLSLIIAHVILGESITTFKFVGVVIIIIGVILIGCGDD
jgi:undecaprenyl phosphate-alpha-L-ara4N flippase subunit ArnE